MQPSRLVAEHHLAAAAAAGRIRLTVARLGLIGPPAAATAAAAAVGPPSASLLRDWLSLLLSAVEQPALSGRVRSATAHYSGRLGRRASGLGGATHSGDGGAPPPRSPLWQHAVLFSACANVTRCSAFPPRAFTFPTQVARKGLQAVASKALRQGTRRVRRHKARVIE